MSNVSKRREGSRTRIKSMGDHKEFLKRITKTLYYGHLPTLPCLSLPVTEISCSVWSGASAGRGRSLRRLHADAAARVARGACVSPCALVLALLYLERLNTCNPDYLRSTAPQDLFLISLMVGNKFLQDDGEDDEVFGSEWAASGGLDLTELNKLELEFLDAIDWNIFVNEESFEEGLSRLERRVALKQGAARGFYTYADLAAACDAARGDELVRALAAACASAAAALAALLASALVMSQACLPALRLLAESDRSFSALSSPLSPLDFAPAPASPDIPTFLNNATVEFAIDALADELDATLTERLECCAAWAARGRAERPRVRVHERKYERAPAPARPALYWSALLSPVTRWLERMAEYAELPETSPGRGTGRCARPWLDLSRLSALLVTVSDR